MSNSLLEHLPTEIFLQIFDFLSLRELTTAFFGLNSHINAIIRSVRGTSHVVRYNDVDAIKLLQLFPIQIGHLTIVNIEMIDFTSLINLRSLTLKYGTQIQFNNILPQHFPMLEILHIKGLHKTIDNDTESISNLFKVILSNGFLRLRICTAFDIGTLAYNDTWTGSVTLRTLNLNMKTTYDCEQLQSICPQLRRLTNYDCPIVIDPTKVSYSRAACRLILKYLKEFERLELENKFVLHENPLAFFGNKKPPPRFTNESTHCRHYVGDHGKDGIKLKGRIFPTTEPYSQASFLIEIVIPKEFPFKPPDVFFVDPIYHPSVDERGYHCRNCWDIISGEGWKPRMSLATFIETTIRNIDSISENSQYVNDALFEEYLTDRQTFYKNALKYTLSYGRPRD